MWLYNVTLNPNLGGGGGVEVIPNLPQSPESGWNSISDYSLTNKNCYNSRTSNDTEMKLGPVTKLDKINMTTTNKMMLTSSR